MNVNYGYIVDGVIFAPVTMCSQFNGIGAWHTLTNEQRAKHGWHPCKVLNESFSALTQSRSELPELMFDGELITATYSVFDKPLETIQSEMLASLAAMRFTFEVEDLNLDSGLRVKTDRESQAQLNSAFVTLKTGLIPNTDWKGSNGWQLVDLEQIEPIARALAAHVRGCFRGERTVGTAITSATTMAQIEAIDIQAQFMAAYQAAVAEVMTPEQAPE